MGDCSPRCRRQLQARRGVPQANLGLLHSKRKSLVSTIGVENSSSSILPMPCSSPQIAIEDPSKVVARLKQLNRKEYEAASQLPAVGLLRNPVDRPALSGEAAPREPGQQALDADAPPPLRACARQGETVDPQDPHCA